MTGWVQDAFVGRVSRRVRTWEALPVEPADSKEGGASSDDDPNPKHAVFKQPELPRVRKFYRDDDDAAKRDVARLGAALLKHALE